jgi:copper resistance protein B
MTRPHPGAWFVAIAVAALPAPALAQHVHDDPPVAETAAEPAATDHSTMDHSAHTPEPAVDHSTMDQSAHTPAPAVDHAAHAAGQGTYAPVPAPTAADRAAAVRPASGHEAHDDHLFGMLLFDRLEAMHGDGDTAGAWDAHGWFGTDIDRLWLRSEGEHAGDGLEHAQVELLYGRSVGPWWDVLAGVRHDTGDAPSQTFAAFGVQGTTPYKVELEATAYLGEGGQSALRVEAEYDTLLSGRLMLQWSAEAEAYGEADARRGLASGLDRVEAGVRLRYEIRREFAPYVGIAWERRFGEAADALRADGHDADDARFVAGVRFWF